MIYDVSIRQNLAGALQRFAISSYDHSGEPHFSIREVALKCGIDDTLFLIHSTVITVVVDVTGDRVVP